MARLKIPDEDRRGLALIQSMPEEAYRALLQELGRKPESIPAVENVSTEDVECVVDAIKGMYRVLEYHEVDRDEFVSDICEALREQNELSPKEEPRFRERLEKALNIDALSIAAKAHYLSYEHEHLYCSARIITDARPVFGKEVSRPPVAMVITHVLKLEYHEAAGELKEIYIGLGTNDIMELQNVLDRAQTKAKSLRDALTASRIPFIDPQQDQ